MWFGFALVGLAVFFCVFGNKQQEASQLYYDAEPQPKEQKRKTTVKVDKQARAKPARQRDSMEDMPADAPVDADTLAQSIYDETDVG